MLAFFLLAASVVVGLIGLFSGSDEAMACTHPGSPEIGKNTPHSSICGVSTSVNQ